MARTEWAFYGRRQELAQLASIMSRGRWFFLKMSGRRRIGKTTLMQEVLRSRSMSKVVYIQIPDSDPAGVISTARDFFAMFEVSSRAPNSRSISATTLCQSSGAAR